MTLATSVGCAITPEWNESRECALGVGRACRRDHVFDVLHHPGVGQARMNRIDANSVARQIDRRCSGQSHDSLLAGGVAGESGEAADPVDR